MLSKFISLIFWYNFYPDCRNNFQLWFAFEIYIFDILIQLRVNRNQILYSCDLLSKFISLIFWYNFIHRKDCLQLVVICFRNLYLWYSDTTSYDTLVKFVELWFAFEIYIFDILIQLVDKMKEVSDGCDLLSKFISLIFWYNTYPTKSIPRDVVICFRNLYLWYSDTTWGYWQSVEIRLWFAFEIYIFDILIQHILRLLHVRCVVICFRNLYLWYSDTTREGSYTQVGLLWFAFEIYIFDILIQHYIVFMSGRGGCDLLSKFISLIFWYNRRFYVEKVCCVVICFRNLYLWYSDTTVRF